MNERPVTLGDLVRFVLSHRVGEAFKDYSEASIANGIELAANQGTMLYSCNEGQVVGIVVASVNDDCKTMWIHDILATRHGVLRQFISEFTKRWPGYTLQGKRKLKEYTMNTERVCKRILEGAQT